MLNCSCNVYKLERVTPREWSFFIYLFISCSLAPLMMCDEEEREGEGAEKQPHMPVSGSSTTTEC